jgi:hypothetical protein
MSFCLLNLPSSCIKTISFSAYSSPIIKRWYLIAMSIIVNMLVPKLSTQIINVALSEPLTPPQGSTKKGLI